MTTRIMTSPGITGMPLPFPELPAAGEDAEEPARLIGVVDIEACIEVEIVVDVGIVAVGCTSAVEIGLDKFPLSRRVGNEGEYVR